MFAIIYRSYVLPGYESQYKDNWYTIANYFVKYRGAIGSCLHQAEDGMYLAYSRWPDKKTRDASWPQSGENPADELPQDIKEAILKIKKCLDESRPFDELRLQVVEDLLLNKTN